MTALDHGRQLSQETFHRLDGETVPAENGLRRSDSGPEERGRGVLYRAAKTRRLRDGDAAILALVEAARATLISDRNVSLTAAEL